MSKENVEVVREAWTVFREQGTAGSVEYYAEDCVVERSRSVSMEQTQRSKGTSKGSRSWAPARREFIQIQAVSSIG
ncbi:MAG TPA: hypothetical protein VIZ91_01315 [Solirubrobacterales bacterium]